MWGLGYVSVLVGVMTYSTLGSAVTLIPLWWSRSMVSCITASRSVPSSIRTDSTPLVVLRRGGAFPIPGVPGSKPTVEMQVICRAVAASSESLLDRFDMAQIARRRCTEIARSPLPRVGDQTQGLANVRVRVGGHWLVTGDGDRSRKIDAQGHFRFSASDLVPGPGSKYGGGSATQRKEITT